jgi:hypothetical protein
MKMKKVYQIKESEIFKIINNLISEENQSNHTVYASGTIGQSPKYDGLKALFKKFKQAVEAELRSGIPYCVVNGSTKVERGSGANEIMLKVTLEPCKEEEKHSFFDLAGAIYSYDYSQNSSNTRAAVFRALGDKAKMFTGTKEGGVRILKTNTVGLVGIKDIDPKNPEKQYTLHIGYVVGIKADDYSELDPLEKPAEAPKSDTDTSLATKPLSVTFAGKTSYDAASDSKAKAELNEIVKDEYTATNCDELHAFQSTSGKVIGNMNVKVGDKLKELYDNGYNPMVTKVDVTVSGMTVGWKCKIENSKDGKAWVGFTSRGAGCNNDVIKRSESKEYGNDKETARKKIMDTYSEKAIDIEKIDEVVYTAGENSFKQIFYVYTKPGKFPPHK